MIANPTMLVKAKRRRTVFAGRIFSPRTVAKMRELAATLRNQSTIALLAGDHNAAQKALSNAESLEVQLAGPNAVALDDILFLQYGSQR